MGTRYRIRLAVGHRARRGSQQVEGLDARGLPVDERDVAAHANGCRAGICREDDAPRFRAHKANLLETAKFAIPLHPCSSFARQTMRHGECLEPDAVASVEHIEPLRSE